ACQLTQEFAFVHAVLKCLTPVNKHHWNFVGELAAQFVVAIDIDFAPAKTAPALQLNQGFLHNFAEVTTLPGIHHDLAQHRHGGSVATLAGLFPVCKCMCSYTSSNSYTVTCVISHLSRRCRTIGMRSLPASSAVVRNHPYRGRPRIQSCRSGRTPFFGRL